MVMKRTIIAVSILLAVGLSVGCDKQPDQISTAQPRPETAAAPQPVAERMPVPEAKEVAPPVLTADQQRCEALEDRWGELDPSYDPKSNRRIEKRGFSDSGIDADYNALKECHRNADEDLRQEKPELKFGSGFAYGLKFGMTEAEIEAPNRLIGKWTVECKPLTYPGTKVASMCDHWNADEFTARISRQLGLGDKVPFVTVMFDSDGRLIALTAGDWVSAQAYKNTSNVIRFWRNETLSQLDIPDQQSELSARWYFKSKSLKDKYGTPKTLESVGLSAARQRNSFFVTVTYTDDENYRQE